MSLEIVSVGSSSSGNSYIIMAGGHTILLDVGLPAKRIMGALEDLGTEPADVEAVLVTHEHSDHVKSVRAVSRKCCNAVFLASRGTVDQTANFCHVPEDRLCIVSAGGSYVIGADDMSECSDYYNNVRITAFSLSHDAAEPTGFAIEYQGEKLAVVTDTGIITDEIFETVSDAGMLVLEANHDEHMLMYGEYPYPVKVRIKSEKGHLSNDYAGEVLAKIMSVRGDAEAAAPLRVMLAHLSFHNNVPLFARHTIEDILEKNGFIKGKDYYLDVAAKEGFTFMPGGRKD